MMYGIFTPVLYFLLQDMFNSVISQLCVLMHRDNVVSTGFHYLSQREFAVAYSECEQFVFA